MFRIVSEVGECRVSANTQKITVILNRDFKRRVNFEVIFNGCPLIILVFIGWPAYWPLTPKRLLALVAKSLRPQSDSIMACAIIILGKT